MKLKELALEQEEKLSLSDLAEDTSFSLPVTNEASDRNKAAYLSLMQGGEDLVQSLQVNLMQDENGERINMMNAYNQLKSQNIESSREVVGDILADQEVDEQTKLRTLQQQALYENEDYDYIEDYAVRSLGAAKVETPDQEEVSFNISEVLPEIVAHRKELQKTVNAAVATNEEGTANALLDLVQFVLPFTEGFMTADLNERIQAGDTSAVSDFIFRGDAKKEMIKAFQSMTMEQQTEFAGLLVRMVEGSTTTALFGENDYAKTDYLRTVFEAGHYGDFEEFLDNATGVLDLVGLGFTVKNVTKALKGFVANATQPTSPSQLAAITDKTAAKKMHDAVVEDETGEIAKATHGTTRDEAILKDEGAKPLDDAVEDQPLVDLEGSTASFSDAELEQATGVAKSRFVEVQGVVNHTVEVGEEAGQPIVRATYSAGGNGWKTAEEALDAVELALRNVGVRREDLQLMVRTPEGYVPTSVKELTGVKEVRKVKVKKGQGKGGTRTLPVMNHVDDYRVSVKSPLVPSMMDVTNPERWSMGLRNFFDSVPITIFKSSGSLTRTLLDPASLFPDFVIRGAFQSVDKAARLEDRLLQSMEGFTETYRKIDSERQLKIEQFLRKSNHEGSWDYSGQGFTQAEEQMLDTWRKGWDNIYHLENKDARKSLDQQGFMRFVDKTNDTLDFAKPIESAGKAKSIRQVYDADADSVRVLTNQEIDELYEAGGQIAELRTGRQIDGENIKFILTKNNGDNYLRKLHDGDQVLNYRKGYYSVKYKSPWFIKKKMKTSSGKEYEKTVAVAGTVKEAKRYMDKLSPEERPLYQMKADAKGFSSSSEEYWDMQQMAGRSAQKFRGQVIEPTTGLEHLGAEHKYVKSPIDALLESTRSIASRTALRDTIGTLKQRFMKTYGETIPPQHRANGYPSRLELIGEEGKQFSDATKDARTLWEYINYLENGYINGIDDMWKNSFNAAAARMGLLSETAEKAARAVGSIAPTQTAKGLAFQLYLGLNPFRQLFVQGNQAIQMLALEPKYFATGLAKDGVLLMTGRMLEGRWDLLPKLAKKYIEDIAKSRGMTLDDVTEMVQAYQRSGLSAAIDKNNLVRGALTEIADYSLLGNPNRIKNKALRTLAKGAKAGSRVATVSRKMGFDAGEEAVMMSSWLTMRHRAMKAAGEGKKLTQRQLDDVAFKARVYTGSMNAAGDMPYNQNLFNTTFQFFQVPHKLALLLSTNRTVSLQDKGRLFLLNTIAYTPIPAAMWYNYFGGWLPQDEEARYALTQGLQGYMLNHLTNVAFGGKGRTDFSSLAAVDMHGTGEFIASLFTLNPTEIFKKSPTGSLFFGSNPRITNLVNTIGDVVWPDERFETRADVLSIGKRVAELSSGYSNFEKARKAIELQNMYNSKRQSVQDDVTAGEAFWKIFGFQTEDEMLSYTVNNISYEASKKMKDDVKEDVSNLIRFFANSGDLRPNELEFQKRAMGWLINIKDKSPKYREMLANEILNLAKDPNDTTLMRIMAQAGISPPEELRKQIMAHPKLEEDQRSNLLKMLDDMDRAAEEAMKDNDY